MRVAIDARKLRDGGIGTYIRNLLREFARAPEGDEFVALVAPEDRGAVESGAVTERVVRAGKYSISEHLVVARTARLASADLLHAPHYTLPLAWRGPAVVTIHDLIHVRHERLFRPGTGLAARWMARAAARRARLVLTGSHHSRDEIVQLLGVPEARIRVTPYGVSPSIGRREPEPTSAFRARRELPAGYLLYVGARKPHKNLGMLLEALARIGPGDRPPLVLSGPPWGADSPQARAARAAGIEGTVHFAGALETEEELSLLYSGAELYAQPSIDEGFGLPVLEAMACGVPVLASRAGALPETVGDAAVLLPPDQPDAWAEAIASLLRDADRRAELVRRGRARARVLTWERTAAGTRAAYREAGEGAGGGAPPPRLSR